MKPAVPAAVTQEMCARTPAAVTIVTLSPAPKGTGSKIDSELWILL